MMLSRRAVDAAREVVSEGDFYSPALGTMFTAALRLRDRNDAVDAITLVGELERAGELDRAGGKDRVHLVATLVPAAGNVAHYAKIVRDKALFRRVGELAYDLTVVSQSETGEAHEVVARVEDLVSKLTRSAETRADKRVPLLWALQGFEERMKNPETIKPGIPVPFSFLQPLQPARLYVLGGYQADGKTVVAAQFLGAAAQAGKKVGFVSIEMGWKDLTDRFISALGVPYHRIQSGEIGSYQEAVDAALRKMALWNVDIIDDSDVNVASLRAYQRSYAYDFLIIDHLHRMDWTDRRDFERTLRGITNIARDFEIPVLLLAQLSRSTRELKSAFPRPTMASLRESGMIEAEAAGVWFVWRHRDDNDLPLPDAEFIVAKNRFGATGVKDLHFNARDVHFLEVG